MTRECWYGIRDEKVFELFSQIFFCANKITVRNTSSPLTRHIEQTPHCRLKSYVPICTRGIGIHKGKKINASHINKLSLNVFRFYCFVFSTRITSWSIRFDDGVIKFKPTVEWFMYVLDLSSSRCKYSQFTTEILNQKITSMYYFYANVFVNSWYFI